MQIPGNLKQILQAIDCFTTPNTSLNASTRHGACCRSKNRTEAAKGSLPRDAVTGGGVTLGDFAS